VEELLGIIGILIVIIEIYRILRRVWIRWMLAKRINGKRTRKPQVMRPKSEKDCPYCVAGKGKPAEKKAELPQAWSQRKGNGGRRKKLSTQGWFCPNEECEYYRIGEETIHALVRNGRHGKHEAIQDLKCQACGKKFTVRRNMVLYRLKTHARVVEQILWLMALGVDSSALEEVFGVRESTIRSWLCRSGQQGRKLHELMVVELELIHIQLDELWADVKHSQQEMWLWVASDAQTKLIPVIQVEGRTQEVAYGVVHELKCMLKMGWVPGAV
jgi:transposase-like protein